MSAKTIKVKTNKKGKRVTSLGDKLPTGIYLRSKNAKNPTYRAMFYRDGKQIYVGDHSSIRKLVKMRNEAIANYDKNRK